MPREYAEQKDWDKIENDTQKKCQQKQTKNKIKAKNYFSECRWALLLYYFYVNFRWSLQQYATYKSHRCVKLMFMTATMTVACGIANNLSFATIFLRIETHVSIAAIYSFKISCFFLNFVHNFIECHYVMNKIDGIPLFINNFGDFC